MNADQYILWTKISGFQLDNNGSSFTFSDRVARENGWTKSYTLRVIEEYKKFIYLCCVSDQGVTPSDPVDQVWHLHLTYTKSYWIEFCQETIGKQIHHNPTKGGVKEAKKFNDYYTHLKQIYHVHFNDEPPVDIWQPNGVRFSDINFQRVNLRRYWLLKKPSRFALSIVTLILIGVIGIVSIQADGYQLYLTVGIIVVGGIIFFVRRYRYIRNNPGRQKDKRKNSGCSGGIGCSGNTEGYYTDSSHHSGNHHHNSGDSSNDSGHSGCSSGCSGCSGSGCSGCGGGGD